MEYVYTSIMVHPRCISGVNLFEYRAMSKIIFKPKYTENDKVFEEENIYLSR